MNISLNNKGKGIISKNSGIRWGYEITGGYMAGPIHLKILYGKKHFINSNQFINYYAYGAGLAIIGYEKAAFIAKKAYKENRPIIDVAAEETGISKTKLSKLLDPSKLAKGGI